MRNAILNGVLILMTAAFAPPVDGSGLFNIGGIIYTSSGSYFIEENEDGVFLVTDDAGEWQLQGDDLNQLKPGDTGAFFLDKFSDPPYILLDRNLTFYITCKKTLKKILALDAPLRSDNTPSSVPKPARKSPIAQNKPTQPQANIFQQFVDASIKDGYVQKTQLDDSWVSVWVRPKFHWLDHDTKRIAAVAFLEWAKQQRPGVIAVYFFDSRDNKRLGRYAEGLGLKLKRPD